MEKRLKISGLQDHLGYWLRFVSNHVSFAFAAKLEQSGVTVAEWVILREMYESDESISPSAIAEATGLSRGAVSKLIDRLVVKELVTREEFAGDRRYQSLNITEKAEGLVPELADLADQNDEEFFSMLGQKERKVLRGILKKIAAGNKLSRVPVD